MEVFRTPVAVVVVEYRHSPASCSDKEWASCSYSVVRHLSDTSGRPADKTLALDIQWAGWQS